MIKKLLLIGGLLVCVGGVGFAFTYGQLQAENVSETKTIEEAFNNVEVKTDNAQVILAPTDGEAEVRLSGEMKGKEHEDFKVSVAGDTLKVEHQTDKRTFRLFSFDLEEFNKQIEVYLPREAYEEISVESSNGVIDVSELNANQVILDTKNGKLRLKQLDSDYIHAKTSNGAIIANDIQGEIKAQTSNGAIQMSLPTIYSPLDLATSNGAIIVEVEEAVNNTTITANTSNGSVHILGSNEGNRTIGDGSVEVKLKTSNGRIELTEK